ncbi:MAG: hypothetical protein QM765_00455 [Myxococcales bacterium]
MSCAPGPRRRWRPEKLGWESTFFTLGKARECRDRFLARLDDVLILGIGLDAASRSKALKATTPIPGASPSGIFLALEKDRPLEAGGTLLGFDVLGLDCGFHSYLCGGAEKDFFARLGAKPNEHGLFDEATAVQCAALVNGDTTMGEPGLWRAWEIRSFPASSGPP